MPAIRILWVDLRCQADGQGLAPLVSGKHRVTKVQSVKDVPGVAHDAHPNLACVEFDYPDEARLLAVPNIRRRFPDLPLLMFTEYHSEALAVRAFRWGVWDYRVKPVSAEILGRSIEDAVARFALRGRRSSSALMPAELAVPGAHLSGPVLTTVRTAAAVAYIADHYAESVTRKAMAARCHLSLSEFSRAFHREHEITFESYLLEFRVARARELLVDSRLTITQVAHAVGFNDSSYFTRAFRRLAGVTASDWRRCAYAVPQRITTT